MKSTMNLYIINIKVSTGELKAFATNSNAGR